MKNERHTLLNIPKMELRVQRMGFRVPKTELRVNRVRCPGCPGRLSLWQRLLNKLFDR
jgi:hypothetical protein